MEDCVLAGSQINREITITCDEKSKMTVRLLWNCRNPATWAGPVCVGPAPRTVDYGGRLPYLPVNTRGGGLLRFGRLLFGFSEVEFDAVLTVTRLQKSEPSR